MNQNSSACISTVDSKGVPYKVRYKRLREATGRSPEEVAALVGLSVHFCYDLEEEDSKLNMQTSLTELSRLSSALGIRTMLIFDDSEGGPPTPPEKLSAKIRDHLASTGMSIAEFEDRVGFAIEPALRDPAEVLKWNVDCLRFVSKEIGVNWLAALP